MVPVWGMDLQAILKARKHRERMAQCKAPRMVGKSVLPQSRYAAMRLGVRERPIILRGLADEDFILRMAPLCRE